MIIYEWMAVTRDGQQFTKNSRPLVRLASAIRNPDRFREIIFFPNGTMNIFRPLPTIAFPAAAGARIYRRQEIFRTSSDDMENEKVVHGTERIQLFKYESPDLNLVARINMKSGLIRMDPI